MCKTVRLKPTAARGLVSVLAQERLVQAFAEHLTLRLKLIRILQVDTQICRAKQVLNVSEENGVRCARAEASQTRPCERWVDRKSTRLNSSHLGISYAVFC